MPLFPAESTPQETPRNPEEIAAHISAHASTDYDPNARAVERTRRHGAGGGIASHLEGKTSKELTPEERGAQLGAAFMENPDQFGSNWPSVQLNNEAKNRTQSPVCADCGATGGCAHMGFRRDGSGYTKGY